VFLNDFELDFEEEDNELAAPLPANAEDSDKHSASSSKKMKRSYNKTPANPDKMSRLAMLCLSRGSRRAARKERATSKTE
jgi:hypothetical protein